MLSVCLYSQMELDKRTDLETLEALKLKKEELLNRQKQLQTQRLFVWFFLWFFLVAQVVRAVDCCLIDLGSNLSTVCLDFFRSVCLTTDEVMCMDFDHFSGRPRSSALRKWMTTSGEEVVVQLRIKC